MSRLAALKWRKNFLSLPFDHLAFTGSTNVGRIVAGVASKNLTPVTLELGGKSPVIIDGSANMKLTIPRIANGKLLNAGQTCVAPDYLLMPEREIDAFSQAIIAKAEEFYPTFAGNPDYTSIIADSHYARLQGLLEDAEIKGAKIQTAGDDDTQVLGWGAPYSIDRGHQHHARYENHARRNFRPAPAYRR